MPVRAGTIDADRLPEPGSIYSLTIRRGQVDPRTGQKVTMPQCFRVRVAAPSGPPEPGNLLLEGVPAGSMNQGWLVGLTVEAFNRDWASHVVAAYGPAPEDAR
ncbi:MAG TPA: hypothetical protein PKG77_19510 [Phycisphaerae bacterium]|nr:hypothetical protein [Phycisphaerae bacterium]HQL75966.1 hypothetical protein [Phycisphaerae bacterium]